MGSSNVRVRMVGGVVAAMSTAAFVAACVPSPSGPTTSTSTTSVPAQSTDPYLRLPTLDGAGAVTSDPSISGDGRFVAFSSRSSNLVAGDTNGHEDVFVWDTVAGTVVRQPLGHDSSQPDGESSQAEISDDGESVVFTSAASNLIPDDSNGASDVFVWEPDSGVVASPRGFGGAAPNWASWSPTISSDGGRVAFVSSASNLYSGAGDTAVGIPASVRRTYVFVWDRADGTIKGAKIGYDPQLSGDGSTVVIMTYRTDHVLEDGHDMGPIFRAWLWDVASGVVRTPSPDVCHDGCFLDSPAVSGNARHLALRPDAAFTGDLSQLPSLLDDLNGDVRQPNLVIDGECDGAGPFDDSQGVDLSSDGGLVVWVRGDLVPVLGSGEWCDIRYSVYVWNTATGEVQHQPATEHGDTVQAWDWSTAAISAGGRSIAFLGTLDGHHGLLVWRLDEPV